MKWIVSIKVFVIHEVVLRIKVEQPHEVVNVHKSKELT